MDTTQLPGAPDRSGERPATATVVTSTACHLCDDALRVLRELEGDGALTLVVHPAESTAGRALIAQHRPGLFPLVLLEGRFLSAGRLSRGRVEKALGHRGARLGGGR